LEFSCHLLGTMSNTAAESLLQHTGHFGKGRAKKCIGLVAAATSVGLLTTFSGVVIELASDLFADLRHGVCVARLPGDTSPLWHATLGGGWRPYDRMRCCGGSALVDHSTQECRAQSIISHSTPKRFAYPLRSVRSFGATVEQAVLNSEFGIHAHERLSLAKKVVKVKRDYFNRTHGHSERSAHVAQLVGADSQRVRAHMSHLFAPDPMEHWAEEAAQVGGQFAAFAAETAEMAVNEDVIQTQSESAGSFAPVYEWVPWDRALGTRSRHTVAVLIYVIGSALLALCAALVTRASPAAKGSGIPEVRASVAGFALPKSFSARTLSVKILALSLCVGAGLAVGKEGPMIHIGACWGAMLAVSGLMVPMQETELITVGAAAGVAAAFGAPLAGVLFTVEELGTTMVGGLRYSTMLCAFGSAVVAALTLKWLDLTNTQRLTLFEVDYKQTWAPWEALPFCLLGIVGGVMGAGFVCANEAVHRRRLQAWSRGQTCWFVPHAVNRACEKAFGARLTLDVRVLEVIALAVLTCLSNYPRTLSRMPQNDAIMALFSQCPGGTEGADGNFLAGHTARDPVGLCSAWDTASMGALLALLIGTAGLRFIQTACTFGTLVPAGLFVPSLYIGGCVGRSMGILLKLAGLPGAQGAVEPGIYAMVGAGAMLAGVSRLTVSLVVVLFELTGGLTYVVPFMLSVLIAKWVGDFLTGGRSVYDVHARFSGFCKVEQSDDIRLVNATLQDLCFDASGAVPSTCSHLQASNMLMPPPLWTRSGHVRISDLVVHCNAAAGGFPVLSADSQGIVDVLGWLRPRVFLDMLTAAEAAGRKLEQWCCLMPPISRGTDLPLQLFYDGAGADEAPCCNANRPSPIDLSQALEDKGVVRVRPDCPLLTALTVFQRCPSVHALVVVDGPPFAAQTVQRELFLMQLVRGRVRTLLPPASAFEIPSGAGLCQKV